MAVQRSGLRGVGPIRDESADFATAYLDEYKNAIRVGDSLRADACTRELKRMGVSTTSAPSAPVETAMDAPALETRDEPAAPRRRGRPKKEA